MLKLPIGGKAICRIFGHRQFSDEVLALRPWEDPEFCAYAQEDFMEPSCLRCGERLVTTTVA